MFPLAHAWLIDRLTTASATAPTPAHYLGCIWPDMLYGSPLSHRDSHSSGARLVDVLRTLPAGPQREEYRAFIVGALSHGSDPHGFAWYSDEQYGDQPPPRRGYAFQQSESLSADAARACGVPPEQGWWKAHNLVEMAFEQPFYSAEPRLGMALAAACADDDLCGRIAGVLSPIFGHPVAALVAPMRRFPSVVSLSPTSAHVLAETYAMQTRIRHPGSAPDVAALAELIQHAQQLIAPTHDAYLADCTRDVGQMIATTVPAE